MLKRRVPYEAVKAEAYEAHQRARELARLKRQAAKLGFTLTSPSAVTAA